jgi:hypothetical protein
MGVIVHISNPGSMEDGMITVGGQHIQIKASETLSQKLPWVW